MSLELETKVRKDFAITKRASTIVFSLLKALRHCAMMPDNVTTTACNERLGFQQGEGLRKGSLLAVVVTLSGVTRDYHTSHLTCQGSAETRSAVARPGCDITAGSHSTLLQMNNSNTALSLCPELDTFYLRAIVRFHYILCVKNC